MLAFITEFVSPPPFCFSSPPLHPLSSTPPLLFVVLHSPAPSSYLPIDPKANDFTFEDEKKKKKKKGRFRNLKGVP